MKELTPAVASLFAAHRVEELIPGPADFVFVDGLCDDHSVLGALSLCTQYDHRSIAVLEAMLSLPEDERV